MTRREEILVQLLERYNECTEPQGRTGVLGDGDAVPHMPPTYTASIRELERLLILMRTERRSQWWHVTQRYIHAIHVQRNMPTKRKGKNGKTVTVIEPAIVCIWDPAVRAEKVRRGITWLADNWALDSEPMLPTELLVAA